MMRSIVFIIIISIAGQSSLGQATINQALKKELDSIYIQDQKFRELISSDLLRLKSDSIADSYKIPHADLVNFIIKQIPLIDSANLLRVEQIIATHGYPGKTLVGIPTNEAAFYVIQHSKNIEKYLPVVKEAADQQELPFTLYAMMLDRSLMYNGQEQVYGTQGKGLKVKDPVTGTEEFKMIIWPIKNASQVNELRKKVGFKLTVEENATDMGIKYKMLTLEDVKKML